jgi:homotetrameric cytidine deaminase
MTELIRKKRDQFTYFNFGDIVMEEHVIDTLISKSKLARENSYSPYSGFKVGAALLSKSGQIYTGCNYENASFGAGVCAERVALGTALANGEREFIAVCVCAEKIVSPCGICRQSLAEFGDMDVIFCDLEGNHKIYRLSALLPEAFKLDT